MRTWSEIQSDHQILWLWNDHRRCNDADDVDQTTNANDHGSSTDDNATSTNYHATSTDDYATSADYNATSADDYDADNYETHTTPHATQNNYE